MTSSIIAHDAYSGHVQPFFFQFLMNKEGIFVTYLYE